MTLEQGHHLHDALSGKTQKPRRATSLDLGDLLYADPGRAHELLEVRATQRAAAYADIQRQRTHRMQELLDDLSH